MSTDAFAPAVFPRLRDAAAEAEHRRAHQRGYADGHAEGFRVAAAEAATEAARARVAQQEADAVAAQSLASALSALEAATTALSARIAELSQADERAVSARAIELAETILGEQLADRELAAVGALRRALSAGDGGLVSEVRLSAGDERTLRDRDAVPAGVSVVVDETLATGDAVVVLPDGIVDARIGAALERARRALDEAAL